nr:DoxX family membrane protein [Actinomycetales bacterium]
MNLPALFARPMLASYFILDGISSMLRPQSHVEKFERVTPLLERSGLPPVLSSDATMLARVAGGVSAAAGIALALGKQPRVAAGTLALLNIPITLINNPVWEKSSEEPAEDRWRGLLRGLGIGGGLILAATDRGGRPSLGWRVQNTRDHRADLRDQKSALMARYAGN